MAIRENFICEIHKCHPFAKIFSREINPLYGRAMQAHFETCRGVAFVHVLMFATCFSFHATSGLHSMLLLVFIPCYFWSSFHATSGLHSIPERLNMEQETDASLIALTTHFAQVREGYDRNSIFASNLASFPARLTPPHLL